MILSLILGTILGGLSVVFALQNIAVIQVKFFSWQLEGSLAIILLLTLVMGVLITLIFLLPESIRNYFKYKKLLKENLRLEEELRKQKELTVFAKTVPPTPSTIEKIEDGAIAESSAV